MEENLNIKNNIFAILDEIVEINENILKINDQGLTKETLHGLYLYKDDLARFLKMISMITSKN